MLRVLPYSLPIQYQETIPLSLTAQDEILASSRRGEKRRDHAGIPKGDLRPNRSRLLKPLNHHQMIIKISIIEPVTTTASSASRARVSTSGAVGPSRAAPSTRLTLVSTSGGRTAARLSSRRLVGQSVLVSVSVCIAGAPALVSTFMLSASSLSLDSSYSRSPTSQSCL